MSTRMVEQPVLERVLYVSCDACGNSRNAKGMDESAYFQWGGKDLCKDCLSRAVECALATDTRCLVSAASDMLDALEMVDREMYIHDYRPDVDSAAHLKIVRTAISKAKCLL